MALTSVSVVAPDYIDAAESTPPPEALPEALSERSPHASYDASLEAPPEVTSPPDGDAPEVTPPPERPEDGASTDGTEVDSPMDPLHQAPPEVMPPPDGDAPEVTPPPERPEDGAASDGTEVDSPMGRLHQVAASRRDVLEAEFEAKRRPIAAKFEAKKAELRRSHQKRLMVQKVAGDQSRSRLLARLEENDATIRGWIRAQKTDTLGPLDAADDSDEAAVDDPHDATSPSSSRLVFKEYRRARDRLWLKSEEQKHVRLQAQKVELKTIVDTAEESKVQTLEEQKADILRRAEGERASLNPHFEQELAKVRAEVELRHEGIREMVANEHRQAALEQAQHSQDLLDRICPEVMKALAHARARANERTFRRVSAYCNIGARVREHAEGLGVSSEGPDLPPSSPPRRPEAGPTPPSGPPPKRLLRGRIGSARAELVISLQGTLAEAHQKAEAQRQAELAERQGEFQQAHRERCRRLSQNVADERRELIARFEEERAERYHKHEAARRQIMDRWHRDRAANAELRPEVIEKLQAERSKIWKEAEERSQAQKRRISDEREALLRSFGVGRQVLLRELDAERDILWDKLGKARVTAHRNSQPSQAKRRRLIQQDNEPSISQVETDEEQRRRLIQQDNGPIISQLETDEEQRRRYIALVRG